MDIPAPFTEHSARTVSTVASPAQGPVHLHGALPASSRPSTGRRPAAWKSTICVSLEGGSGLGCPLPTPAVSSAQQGAPATPSSRASPSRKQPCLDHVSRPAQLQGQVKPSPSVTRWKAEGENQVFYLLLSWYKEHF